jgi:hypothetical protein
MSSPLPLSSSTNKRTTANMPVTTQTRTGAVWSQTGGMVEGVWGVLIWRDGEIERGA